MYMFILLIFQVSFLPTGERFWSCDGPIKNVQQNAQAKWVVVFGEAVKQIWNEWAKCVCNWFCYSDCLGLHSLLLLLGASLFKDWNVRAGNGEDHHRARGSGSQSDNDDDNNQPQHDAIVKLHSMEMEEPSPGNKSLSFLSIWSLLG